MIGMDDEDLEEMFGPATKAAEADDEAALESDLDDALEQVHDAEDPVKRREAFLRAYRIAGRLGCY